MRHKEASLSIASIASVDLDVEGGSRLDDDYDGGWPSSATLSWSSKGPAWNETKAGLLESARVHLAAARAGWGDANAWLKAFEIIQSSPEVRNGTLKGLLLSSTIIGLIFMAELAFLPSHNPFKHAQTGSDDTIGSVGNTFWLYPLIAGSYYLASNWSTEVAQAAYKLRHGRGLSLPSNAPSGFLRGFVNESYRIILIANYSLICLALQRIPLPYVGRWLSFAFMSLIDGYYCFEQAWIARGWPVERRMRFVESRWAYFIAFGLPSTFVSFFHPSSSVNLFLFMLIFPICTVLAMFATPPRGVGGGGATPSSATFPGGGGSSFSALSPLLPARIPVFWITVKLYRVILRLLPPAYESLNGNSHSGNGWGEVGSTNAYGSNGYSSSSASALDHGSYQQPGRRTAAQFVGGAWAGTRATQMHNGPPQPSANGWGGNGSYAPPADYAPGPYAPGAEAPRSNGSAAHPRQHLPQTLFTGPRTTKKVD